jgi:outer membrane protein TolC
MFRKINILLLIFIGIQASAQNSAGRQYSFTLQQAVDFALQNQVNVKNAILDQQIAQKKVNELLGVGLPQINGSADITHYIDIPTTFVPAQFFGGEDGTYAAVKFGQPYTSSAGLSASQLIFDGSYLVGVKASRMYAELMRKQATQTKTETAALVSKAYYNVLINTERVQLLDANVMRLKKIKEDTKALFDNGFVEKIDFDRASLAYNNVVTEKNNFEKILNLSVDLLKFQMGMEMSDQLVLSDKLDDIKSISSVAESDTIDITKRIELEVLNTTKKLLETDLKLKKVSYLPSLVAFGTYSVNASRSEFDIFENKPWFRTTIVGLKLNVPIFDGFQKAARVNQARFEVQKIDNTIKSSTQGMTLEAKSARTTLLNALSSLQNQEQNRKLAADIARVTKIKYEQGVGSSLEVMNAETDLKAAETNYYAAMVDAYIARVDYAKATGTLIK